METHAQSPLLKDQWLLKARTTLSHQPEKNDKIEDDERDQHFGAEHLDVRLVPNLPNLTDIQKQNLEKIEFCYLPHRGLGGAMLASAIAHNFHELCQTFHAVYLDWPAHYQDQLSKIEEFFPAGLVLCENAAFEEGLKNQLVDLVEPLDPRRVLIKGILSHPLGLNNTSQIECLGACKNELGEVLEGAWYSELEDRLSTLEILPGGSFSFLEARLGLLKELMIPTEETYNSQNIGQVFAVAKILVEGPEFSQILPSKTLVVLNELGFLYFPKLLTKILADLGASEQKSEQKSEQRSEQRSEQKLNVGIGANVGQPPVLLPTVLRQRAKKLVLARISDEHLAQHSACNAPTVKCFLEILENTKTSLAPFELFSKSLHQSFVRSAAAYAAWTKTRVSQHAQSQIFRYMYLLAKEDDRRFPNQFEILLAAQSVVNSNLSFEWLKDCRSFPESTHTAFLQALPLIDVPLENWVAKVTTLSITRFETLQSKKPRPRLQLAGKKQQRRQALEAGGVDESKYADNKWVHGDHPYSCSFPQEDADMEEFAFDLARQAKEKSLAKEKHTFEMTTSIADGLNARETVRNWHRDQIMVNEELNLERSDIGATVFEFGANLEDSQRFSWRAFWQAEFHDKSHLMFYATPFQDEIIGPGIARSEFGGFSVLPLTAIAFDPWQDPFIQAHCQQPIEALLLASALGTLEKNVLFISDRPPPVWLTRLLRQSGKAIIFQNANEVPQDKLRRLKTFHILAEAGVRGYAHKYIRKDTIL